MRRLAVLLGLAAALLVVELALGAIHFGKPKLADPCTSKPAFKGGGIDGEIQRFALSGLNGAACKLHTTREELVLSFVPAAGTKRVRWDRATIEDALRSGFDRAFEDTEQRGVAGFVIGHILEVVLGAPLDYFLDVSSQADSAASEGQSSSRGPNSRPTAWSSRFAFPSSSHSTGPGTVPGTSTKRTCQGDRPLAVAGSAGRPDEPAARDWPGRPFVAVRGLSLGQRRNGHGCSGRASRP